MSYEKIGFTDGTTPLDMENFNHMEDGIAANADALDDKADKEDLDKLSEDVDKLNADLTDMTDDLSSFKVISASSMSEFYEKAFDFPTNSPFLVKITANCMSEITNGDNTYVGVGIAFRISSDAVDWYSFGIQGLRLYGGRIVSGAVNRVYKYSYSAIVS